MDLTFRNAEEKDAGKILELIDDHALGGTPLIDHILGKGHADGMKTVRAMVEAGDTEYGFEQATLAEDGDDVAGVFIGFPRDALSLLGPRSLKAAMGTKSPLSWPGLVARQAKLARLESAPPPDAYLLVMVCARGVERLATAAALINEALSEAVDEECTAVVVNLFSSDPEYIQLLREAGFAELARKPIPDSKLRAAFGIEEVVQWSRDTGFVPVQSAEEEENEAVEGD